MFLRSTGYQIYQGMSLHSRERLSEKTLKTAARNIFYPEIHEVDLWHVHSRAFGAQELRYCRKYGRFVARLRRRRCASAPTSNTASHDYHDKINSWISFFPKQAWCSTWQLFGQSEIR